MNTMTIKEIGAAVGFPIEDEAKIAVISTDSRDITPGCLFVALRGENFDGHQYVSSALKQGAAFALVDTGDRGDPRLIFCKDPEQGFLDIAGYYRSKFSPKVVAVTGSVGKTTTKEMISAVLEAGFATLKNKGNLNNRVGLPKTLLELAEYHEAAVLEMGMNHFGEISDLSRRGKPDMAVITNIGVCHIEFLGSREGILKAKMEIRDGMAPGSPLILCGDDDLLWAFQDEQHPIITYGITNQQCDIIGRDIVEKGGETTFVLCCEGRELTVKIPTFGEHNVRNALAAYAVGKQFGMEDEAIVQALANYTPAGMRQRIVRHSGFTVVEDCYNCSPESLKAAAAAFASMECEGKKIFALGDMLELGSHTAQAHYECGLYAARQGIDAVYCFGPASQNTCRGAQEGGAPVARHFSTKEEMAQALVQQLTPGDILWVKGSRGMALEDVLSKIYKER